MRKKRTTRITVETEQILVISSPSREVEGWCDGCGKRVRMITSEKAAALTGAELWTIRREVEGDKLHYTETTDGRLICLNSFLSIYNLPRG